MAPHPEDTNLPTLDHQVRITCHDEGSEWALYETAQKFCKDGRCRVRNRPLAEKKKPGEEAVDAAIRGVSEELGSVLTADQLASISIRKDDIQQVTASSSSVSINLFPPCSSSPVN
jgi:hypothetical protein